MNERRWTLEEPKTRHYVPLEHQSEFTGRQFDSSTMGFYRESVLDTHQAKKVTAFSSALPVVPSLAPGPSFPFTIS